MRFEIEDIDARTLRVRLAGRLDAPGADRIGLPFTASLVGGGRHVLLDLGGVEFLSSLGIRLLLSVARAMKQKGFTLVMFGAGTTVRDVLETVAVGSVVPLVADEPAALALLPPA